MLLKKLVTNKISINTVNGDQKNFVFNLMKGYNARSFSKKSKIRDLELIRICMKEVSLRHFIFS